MLFWSVFFLLHSCFCIDVGFSLFSDDNPMRMPLERDTIVSGLKTDFIVCEQDQRLHGIWLFFSAFLFFLFTFIALQRGSAPSQPPNPGPQGGGPPPQGQGQFARPPPPPHAQGNYGMPPAPGPGGYNRPPFPGQRQGGGPPPPRHDSYGSHGASSGEPEAKRPYVASASYQLPSGGRIPQPANLPMPAAPAASQKTGEYLWVLPSTLLNVVGMQQELFSTFGKV